MVGKIVLHFCEVKAIDENVIEMHVVRIGEWEKDMARNAYKEIKASFIFLSIYWF